MSIIFGQIFCSFFTNDYLKSTSRGIKVIPASSDSIKCSTTSDALHIFHELEDCDSATAIKMAIASLKSEFSLDIRVQCCTVSDGHIGRVANYSLDFSFFLEARFISFKIFVSSLLLEKKTSA